MSDRQVVTCTGKTGHVFNEQGISNHYGFLAQILAKFISSFLAHYQQYIRMGNPREMDGLVADDNFGLGGTATGFRTIRLGLNSQLAIQERSFCQNNAGRNQTLTAGAGETEFMLHVIYP